MREDEEDKTRERRMMNSAEVNDGMTFPHPYSDVVEKVITFYSASGQIS